MALSDAMSREFDECNLNLLPFSHVEHWRESMLGRQCVTVAVVVVLGARAGDARLLLDEAFTCADIGCNATQGITNYRWAESIRVPWCMPAVDIDVNIINP